MGPACVCWPARGGGGGGGGTGGSTAASHQLRGVGPPRGYSSLTLWEKTPNCGPKCQRQGWSAVPEGRCPGTANAAGTS